LSRRGKREELLSTDRNLWTGEKRGTTGARREKKFSEADTSKGKEPFREKKKTMRRVKNPKIKGEKGRNSHRRTRIKTVGTRKKKEMNKRKKTRRVGLGRNITSHTGEKLRERKPEGE